MTERPATNPPTDPAEEDTSRPRRQRWPGWVYGGGDEPDYRFSFANERTFLAWIRTSLAILAGGIAVHALDLSIPAHVQSLLSDLLVALALVCALGSWVRWARAERAMRHARPLPASSITGILAVVVVVAAISVLVGGI